MTLSPIDKVERIGRSLEVLQATGYPVTLVIDGEPTAGRIGQVGRSMATGQPVSVTFQVEGEELRTLDPAIIESVVVV